MPKKKQSNLKLLMMEWPVCELYKVPTSLCKIMNSRAVLMTIPGKEFYPIDVNRWLPEPTEEEIERVEKRKTKRAAKKAVEKKPSEEDEEGEKKPTAEDDDDEDDTKKSVTA